jgi:ABC-2 type transport system permease protein
MSTLSLAVADSTTMLRRNLKHMVRYPTVVLFVIGIPVVLLLLFVYVFGGTLGAGLGDAAGTAALDGGRRAYLDYLVPGILIFTIAGGGQGTAISVAMDMSEGIIARFRTMDIGRGAVLAGHALGTWLQTMLGAVVVLGVALAVGFRPDANPLEWLAAAGLIGLVGLAFIWLCVALGLVAKSVETASNLPMPLLLLPFLGSGFTPTESMPGPVRWFADHQPFTPFTETMRGLLLGTEIGADGVVSVAWCVGIIGLSYLWATSLYDQNRSTKPGALTPSR